MGGPSNMPMSGSWRRPAGSRSPRPPRHDRGSAACSARVIRVARPGETRLRLAYRRPFDPAEPPAATFAVDVMVT
jgi:predicted secreted protein